MKKGIAAPHDELYKEKYEKSSRVWTMTMSFQSLISIIVPVYNVERYLDQCIQSLVHQTYTNLEIIMVDDGSTDSSGRTCDEWAKRDSRIHVIHQSNAGLAAARNTGLDAVTGAYIGFVDSDDYVLPDMFGTLMRNMKDANADLSIVSYAREGLDGKTYCNALPGKKMVMTSEDAFKYVNLHGYFYVVAWDKLAKRELFEGLRYPLDAKYAEDSPVTYQLLDRAERIVYESAPLYRYRMTEGSQSHGITDKFAQSTSDMLEMVRRKYPQDEPYAAYGHLESIVGTYNRIVLAHKRKEWAAFEKYARDRLRCLLPLAEQQGLLSKSQSLQWRLLVFSPALYSMMYRCYKKRHPEIASH